MTDQNNAKEIFKKSQSSTVIFKASGIDVTKVLNRLCIDVESYLLVLNVFNSTYSTIINRINNALIENNVNNARILLHKLEGAAANIGAEGVQLAAFELREKIKEGKKNIDLNINHLDKQIAIILQAISFLGEYEG